MSILSNLKWQIGNKSWNCHNLYNTLSFKSSISIANTDTSLKTTETCKQLNSTPSDERSDVVWIVVVTLLCVLIAICIIFHWIKKRKDLFVQCFKTKMNCSIQYRMPIDIDSMQSIYLFKTSLYSQHAFV